jgi:hypothetical protein
MGVLSIALVRNRGTVLASMMPVSKNSYKTRVLREKFLSHVLLLVS